MALIWLKPGDWIREANGIFFAYHLRHCRERYSLQILPLQPPLPAPHPTAQETRWEVDVRAQLLQNEPGFFLLEREF